MALSVRVAQKEDIPAILSIYGPYVEETAYSFEYTAPGEEEFTKRFMRITRQFPFFVYEEEGQVLGYAYADLPFEREAYSWCAEPSVYLRPDARGRGIGKALYAALEEELTAQGYAVLYAIITTSNADSVAFHKAVGYRHLADFPACGLKFGRWEGITWMEKRLKSVEITTNKPVPYSQIVKYYQK